MKRFPHALLLAGFCLTALSVRAQTSVDIIGGAKPAAKSRSNVEAAVEVASRMTQISGARPPQSTPRTEDNPTMLPGVRAVVPAVPRAPGSHGTFPVVKKEAAEEKAASAEKGKVAEMTKAEVKPSAPDTKIDPPAPLVRRAEVLPEEDESPEPPAAKFPAADSVADVPPVEVPAPAVSAPFLRNSSLEPAPPEPEPVVTVKAAAAEPVATITNADLVAEIPAPVEPEPEASGDALPELFSPAMPSGNGAASGLLPTVPDNHQADHFPDPGDLPSGEPFAPGSDAGASLPETAVENGDLALKPTAGDMSDPSERGPVFRVNGPAAVQHCQGLGYCFTPAGGIGARNGNHTVASQFPNMLTSEVHGNRMVQVKPPGSWALPEMNNLFFMFCDAGSNAVRLNPGWKIRGIQLRGNSWRWVVCPKSGGSTASFSVRLHAPKLAQTNTVVELTGLTLEGPAGAKDWRDAFPDLRRGDNNTPAQASAARKTTRPARVVEVQPSAQ